ncbi:MAG: type II toxin-antitoxin system VapC family toxin [Nanoarchaeota archaeon]
MEEVYLDSNLLIYGILNEDRIGDLARKFIKEVEIGKYNANISALTIDEFIWKVQKVLGRETAVESAKRIINMENVKILEINSEVLINMLKLYKDNKLDPRDSIHLATMQINRIKTVISSDPDFDKIKEIKRIDFSKEL